MDNVELQTAAEEQGIVELSVDLLDKVGGGMETAEWIVVCC